MHRLIPGLALAIVLLLAACRPADQGGGSSASPTQAGESSAPSASETPEATGAGGGAPAPRRPVGVPPPRRPRRPRRWSPRASSRPRARTTTEGGVGSGAVLDAGASE